MLAHNNGSIFDDKNGLLRYPKAKLGCGWLRDGWRFVGLGPRQRRVPSARISKIGVLVGALAVIGMARASSQPVDRPPAPMSVLQNLYGTYRYAGDPTADQATIQKSIEAAISSLGWLGRKIAASRLANHKELPGRIEIKRQGDDVSVAMGQYSAVAPLDGTERALVGPNGRDSKLSYRLGTDELQQFFVFEHAKRKSTYRFNALGQLVMSVLMTSEKLASPIEYELVYVKEAP